MRSARDNGQHVGKFLNDFICRRDEKIWMRPWIFGILNKEAAGTLTNSASTRSGYADPDLSDNDSSITTTVLPFPVLTIQRASPTQVRISWPVVLTNFALEYNNSFTNTGWTNDVTTPDISGDQKSVLVTNSGSGNFYRLKQ